MAFKIEMVGDSHARINFYGVVGYDIQDSEFIEQIDALGDVATMELRLNSPGGDVFQGLAIYNRLREHPAKKTAIVDGAALSVMSVIMLAADEREVRKGGRVMVHEPHGVAVGRAADFRAYAEQMDVTTSEVADIYAERTNWKRDEAIASMENETWLSATQALEAGFATRESKSLAIAAYFDANVMSMYKHVPLDMHSKLPSSKEYVRRRLRLAGINA